LWVASLASEETKPRQLELADYVRMLQKRMWFIGVVMAAAMIVGGLYVQASEELYRATALVVVRQRPRGFFWLTGEQTNIMPTFAMETHARIAQGTNVAKRVVKWLERPPYGYEPIIATAEKVRKSLEVSVIEPDLLRIDATSPDKIRAMRFAEASADAFEEENTEMRRQESSDACVFLKDQVEQAKNELDAVMQESVDLSREAGMVDVEAEATAATAELREYENQRRQIWAELRQAGAQLATLQETMASEQEVIVEENPVPNPAWTTVNGQLIGARIALAELRARYTEEHPGLQDASARVKELEEELANTPELLVMPQVRRSELIASLRRELAEAKVKVKVLEARHTALESIIADLRTRNLELPEGRQRWQSLNDRKELARNVYQSLSDELRQAKLNEQITQANAWVIDRPVSALLLRASLGRSLVFSGMLGLLCGVAGPCSTGCSSLRRRPV